MLIFEEPGFKPSEVASGAGGCPLRTIIVVALALVALVAAPALAANSVTVHGTQPPAAAAALSEQVTGYYPDAILLLAGDAIRFDSLLPLDIDHPPLVLRGPEDGEREILSPDEGGYFRQTTYSGLQPGHYTFQCIFHPEMTGTFEVL